MDDPKPPKKSRDKLPRIRTIEWQQQQPGFDLYFPQSAAAQLGSASRFLGISEARSGVARLLVGSHDAVNRPVTATSLRRASIVVERSFNLAVAVCLLGRSQPIMPVLI
jgi:hypothetical protein